MSTKTKSKKVNDTNTSAAYRELVDELAVFTDLSAKLADLDARFQAAHAELVREAFREDFAELQDALGEAELQVKCLALAHPEWFEKSKTVKTPFGSVGWRTSTKLEAQNEELTLALLDRMGEEGKPFVRERKFLNLEALETLDDAELTRLLVLRVTTDKCTVSPAKVDLGKAVATVEKGGAK